MKSNVKRFLDLLARSFVAAGAVLTLMYAIYFIIDLIKGWY